MIRVTSVVMPAALAAVATLVVGTAPATSVVARHAANLSAAPRGSTQQVLRSHNQLGSPNGLHVLAMQADGNLVLRAGGAAVWSTGTEGHPGAYAMTQADGNLVVRQGRQPLWSSGSGNTRQASRVVLAVQDDGNLVVRQVSAAGASTTVWASGTSDAALRQIRVRTGCPATLVGSYPVANAPEGLVTTMVPTGSDPDSALVCRYPGTYLGGDPTLALAESTALAASAAASLAATLGRVTLGFPGGAVPCPAGNGSQTIIAFAYHGRLADVDVDYSTSGCQTLTNGYVVAGLNGNPSLNAFQAALSKLAPTSN